MHMRPLVIATVFSLLRGGRIAEVTFEPSLNDIVIELLRPKHARDGLTHHVFGIRTETGRRHGGVVLIGLLSTIGESRIEACAERPSGGRGHFFVGEAKL